MQWRRGKRRALLPRIYTSERSIPGPLPPVSYASIAAPHAQILARSARVCACVCVYTYRLPACHALSFCYNARAHKPRTRSRSACINARAHGIHVPIRAYTRAHTRPNGTHVYAHTPGVRSTRNDSSIFYVVVCARRSLSAQRYTPRGVIRSRYPRCYSSV